MAADARTVDAEVVRQLDRLVEGAMTLDGFQDWLLGEYGERPVGLALDAEAILMERAAVDDRRIAAELASLRPVKTIRGEPAPSPWLTMVGLPTDDAWFETITRPAERIGS